MKLIGSAILICLMVAASIAVGGEGLPDVPNPGFEDVSTGRAFPDGWTVDIGGGAQAKVESDETVRRSGRRSIHITNTSPMKAFVYASFYSRPVAVKPSTTYVLSFHAKGKGAKGCFLGIGFEGDGERRQYLPADDFDWRGVRCTFTTPERCSAVRIRFTSDDVTSGLWIDDVSLAIAPRQLTHLRERRHEKAFQGVFPRSPGPVASRLVVCDLTNETRDMELAVTAMQGIVNRSGPRIYLIHRTNPPRYDDLWLKYMQEKKYTGQEERISNARNLVARFRRELQGVIVCDPELPGSVNAACMLAGLKKALPVSPALAKELGLPVLMDLRGKWKRNVDAYRYIYEHHWNQMNHHVLAWIHPLSEHYCVRDYMVEFNVFCFWLSGYRDNEKGADPAAEEAFIDELLSETPANTPVMGWPAHADTKGTTEYAGVRWLSEYGKFVPGTEFCSNLSVHTAIRPDDRAFTRKSSTHPAAVRLEADKVYISVNVLDSGDNLWYWQFHQRKIWSGPTRGQVPIGWCMNITLHDALPLVLQWYCENATENDTFFAGISGLGYMNTQAYAGRFCPVDRERIWREYVALTDDYCRRLGIDGVELYNGGWGEPTPPSPETFARFARGMKDLRYIIADLGRHECVKPETANYMVDNTAVFHTLTRFQLWSSSAEVAGKQMADANSWLLGEICTNTPAARPGFMSAMAISWYYYPSWFKDLRNRLSPYYVLVGPGELARLFGEWQRTRHP